MSTVFYFEDIHKILSKKQTKNGLSHDTGNVKDAFPFTSSKLTRVFNESINEIIGELVRITNNFKEPTFTDESDFTYSDYPLINNVVDNVEFRDDENHEVLAGFLEDFLFKNNSELKPLHLYLFNYITLLEEKKGDKKEKEKYSRFIYDLLFDNNEQISSLFSSKETNNLLTELIISSLPELESKGNNQQNKEPKYSNTLPLLKELFIEDFLYLSKQKDYFIKHFFNIVHFYTFQYVLQFLRKSQKFGNESLQKLDSFYFTFDWETGIGGYRQAVEDYRMIKNNAHNLFVHIHCLSHLSQSKEDRSDLKTYKAIIETLQELSSSEQLEEKQKLIDWIKEYSNLAGQEVPNTVNEDSTFSDLFKALFSQLQEGMSKEVCLKYGKNIDNLGKSKFLKARGKHGYILSLKQDDFLMLSAVAVKNEKISLKEFFIELERRGMAFDQYSKKEAIHLLEQQNYIEKKSDSGDAQYVKPIF
ncbi:DNA phosphorothioation-dependent restriction protein DptG [Halobacillus faecis]|uniref:DNA phosphorothioation-dependent restriction protein DptG n=1 Tax=Halobacillus faecis TaxID=360184 RepID=A0A511WMQ8_9BACI|nr:DNA phosphorothioation-dependent restriction protein DptG [Halobacillus faecis]GEN52419.1 hypothetical protein HFA01_06810 [Halobacillus faecis]